MALTRTLSAPNGVTRVAGAKAYAAKLATSPAPIDSSPALMEPFLASRRRPFQNETPSSENTGTHSQSQTNVKVILSMPLAHFACYLKSYCESH